MNEHEPIPPQAQDTREQVLLLRSLVLEALEIYSPERIFVKGRPQRATAAEMIAAHLFVAGCRCRVGRRSGPHLTIRRDDASG